MVKIIVLLLIVLASVVTVGMAYAVPEAVRIEMIHTMQQADISDRSARPTADKVIVAVQAPQQMAEAVAGFIDMRETGIEEVLPYLCSRMQLLQTQHWKRLARLLQTLQASIRSELK